MESKIKLTSYPDSESGSKPHKHVTLLYMVFASYDDDDDDDDDDFIKI